MKITSAFYGKDFEDRKVLADIEKIFEKKRGYAFHMPQKGEPVVLLLSGGLDSVCLWEILMSKLKLHVYPLYISSNTFYDPQQFSVKYFSSYFKKKYPKLFHSPEKIPDRLVITLKDIITRRIAHKDLAFAVKNIIYNKDTDKYNIILLHGPSRQARFAFDAYEYAHILKYKHNIDIHTIFAAISKDDTTFMRESTLTVMRSINLSLCLILGDFNWQYTGMLEKKAKFFYGRNDLMRIALKDKLPLEKTWSCHRNLIFHCGLCPGCTHRKRTFQELSILDRTTYFPFMRKVRDFIIKENPDKVTNFPKENRALTIPANLENQTVSIASNIDWQIIDGSMYLWNKKNGNLESVNNTASYIFEQIKKEKAIKVSKLILQMHKKYKIAQKQLKSDVTSYIRLAIQKRYLVLD